MDGAKISPKTLDSENDIDTLCLRAVHALMKDGASRKKLSPRDIRAQKRTKLNFVSNETELSNLEDGSVENARDIRAHIEQDGIMSLMRLSCLILKTRSRWCSHHHCKSQ